MIYLSGAGPARREAAALEAAGIGLIAQPGIGSHGPSVSLSMLLQCRCWAADNGCFASRWEEDAWLAWLNGLPRAGCLFAVAPDVYPDAAATLQRSAPFLPLIRELGFPVALVAQDGAESLALPWDDFDCLFIGGQLGAHPRREWKESPAAERLGWEARRRGKWVHMGRVNSLTRMERARSMGCCSVDGTFIKWRNRPARGRGGGAVATLAGWSSWLAANPAFFTTFETPALPAHRQALMP